MGSGKSWTTIRTPPRLGVSMTAMAPATDRTCGTCTLCCKVMSVAALHKPFGVWCDHCSPGRGCRIYEDRPAECRTFKCLWLSDESLGPEWKPERSKLVLTTAASGNGIEVRCDPGFPSAWRREPYYSRILEWAQAAVPTNGTVIVCVDKRETLVTPDGEFYLGEGEDDDRIVREMVGGRVTAARLEKAADLNPELDATGAKRSKA